VQAYLDVWYRERSREVFPRYLDAALERYRRLGLKSIGLQLRSMKKRWGSYTASGRILLNPELIKAPIPCIEYVIVHELCHSVVPNHGKAFVSLLTRCIPDWKKRKERLEATMQLL